jgi:1-acyl-sn-glycerol-3-phosphate acyltransferase
LRNLIFNISYWVISIFYGVLIVLLGFFNCAPISRTLAVAYAKTMSWAMRYIAGIDFEFRGLENLPKNEPFIIASKHQSWGDGYMIMAKLGDLAIVIGNHVEVYPLMKQVLKNIGAIVVAEKVSRTSNARIKKAFEIAKNEGRNVLIYPEGNLVKIGERIRYRSGIYNLQQQCGWQVVPVATNLGLFWSCREAKKERGTAVNQFLKPIPAGLSKAQFMETLENELNEASKELCKEGQRAHPYLSQADVEWPLAINSDL